MNATTQTANSSDSRRRSLITGMCAIAAFALATQASALTSIGQGAFSPTATKITFEDLPGDNSDIPAGYASGVGVSSWDGFTESEVYADYGPTLPINATAAGLGNVGATWDCDATCGTGFTLNAPRTRVGFFLSSNVPITTQVSAFRGGVLLGSVTPSFATNEIGFVGLEDPAGIDRIAIGANTADPGSINQLDNVMFENAVAGPQATAVPTISQWAMMMLSGLLASAALFALRRRRH